MGERHRAEPASNIENRLRRLRTAKGLSQGELAGTAEITRQAVCAIEGNQYLPTTAVALRLAHALGCRVEDLFSLKALGETLEGELVGKGASWQPPGAPMRVKVARVGSRLVVRPVDHLGDVLTYSVPADGLIVGAAPRIDKSSSVPHRVTVRLLRDRRAVEQNISVAGCDPAIFLAGDYLRRLHETATVVGWTMGSSAALQALKRGDVHMAGLHIVDPKTGESNLPYLRRHLTSGDFSVVTFATWEEGLLVRERNPRGIRDIADVARKDVTLVNREKGAGARLLLDQKLAEAGIKPVQVKGYAREVLSHFQVARSVAEGQADVGVGVRSAAQRYGLDFLPLQEARYDLVFPKAYLTGHPSVANFLEAITGRRFRAEVEALGGYDTRETGTVRVLKAG